MRNPVSPRQLLEASREAAGKTKHTAIEGGHFVSRQARRLGRWFGHSRLITAILIAACFALWYVGSVLTINFALDWWIMPLLMSSPPVMTMVLMAIYLLAAGIVMFILWSLIGTVALKIIQVRHPGDAEAAERRAERVARSRATADARATLRTEPQPAPEAS